MMSMHATELEGRPVINGRTGRTLGRVRQVVIDVPNRRVAGFRLRCGGLLDRRWRLAAMPDVAEVDAHGVMLPDAVALREDEQQPGQLRLARGRRPVIDEHGCVLGSLVDVEVDVATGSLLGLVLDVPGRAPHGRQPWTLPIGLVRGLDPSGAIVCDTAADAHTEDTNTDRTC